ncbi:hypothetical protein XH84_00285 [Bradyrhizobium nanningense]|nr:hypothetical protein XH84_00285 [Bradyrhizobium nanningense]
MKLQPAQHGLTRPTQSDVEGVSADARLAVHAPGKETVMPLSAADPLHMLRIIQLAFFLSEFVRPGMQGAIHSCGASGTPVGRRRPSTPSLCQRHDILCLIGKIPVRSLTINRISGPIIRAHAGSIGVGKCNARGYRQWNIAS